MRNLACTATLILALSACAGDPGEDLSADQAAPAADTAALQSVQGSTPADNTGDQTNIDTDWANREEAEQAATQDEFHPYHYSDNHAQPDPL